MILNGICNRGKCIIAKLLNFIIPKCQFNTNHIFICIV